jgi:hypothetical protein
MNLITKSGLLYNLAMAQNDQYGNGSYGSFLMIDWAATFIEVATVDTVSSVNYWTIGLNPVVTSLVACYDGGKALAGYGKYSGLVHFGWVMKMWGNTGSTWNCGASSKPVGYVEILMSPVATATAGCLTNVQWMFNLNTSASAGAGDK